MDEINKTEKKPKFWKRKIGILGKQIPVIAVLLVLVGGLGGATLLTYFGQVKTTVDVKQAVKLNGNDWDVLTENTYSIYNGWEQHETDPNILSNDADKDLNVDVTSDDGEEGITVTHDSVGLSTEKSTEATAFADVTLAGDTVSLEAEKNSGSDASEARITILGNDVGVKTLNDLDNFSWDVVGGVGYAPHLDVFLDTDDNGISDTTLTFEYAKVNPADCDDSGNYPTGSYNTFVIGDKGIIDGTAYAWESIPGPCGDSSFDAQHKSLTVWKTTYGSARVLRFELEVDAWILDSSADISNIEVNGVEKEITTYSNPVLIEAESELVLYINSVFDEMIGDGDYVITTTVTLP